MHLLSKINPTGYMKTIKKLAIIIATITFSFAEAQEVNNLSLNEFYNEICFDNVCLNKIIDTHNSSGNIQSLFSSVIRTRDDNTTKSLDYEIGGYYFRFEELSSSEKDTDYSLSYITVEGNSKIKIKNRSIGVGDNISILGNVTILELGNIAFYNKDTNASIDILYSNNMITEINFVFD